MMINIRPKRKHSPATGLNGSQKAMTKLARKSHGPAPRSFVRGFFGFLGCAVAMCGGVKGGRPQ
jgi:hypothetical protein